MGLLTALFLKAVSLQTICLYLTYLNLSLVHIEDELLNELKFKHPTEAGRHGSNAGNEGIPVTQSQMGSHDSGINFHSRTESSFFKSPTPTLMAFTGVINTHRPTPQPTACRSPTWSLTTATGSNQA